MLQSVTPKITYSKELETQIQFNHNQTCWVHETSIDSLRNKDFLLKKSNMADLVDKTLIFGPPPPKWPKNSHLFPAS